MQDKIFNHIDLPPVPTLRRIDGEPFRLYETPEGKRYPSVTSILGAIPKPELDAWKARVGPVAAAKISSEATRRGSKIHSLAEGYLSNTLEDVHVDPFTLNEFSALKKVLRERVDNVRAIELQLYSDRLRAAGTMDLLGDLDGTLTVMDHKTSKRTKHRDEIEGYFIQLTTYAMMVMERTGLVVKDIAVLMLVDGGESIVFKEKTKDHIGRVFEVRRMFQEKNGI